MKVSFSFVSINRLAVPAIVAGVMEPILSLSDTAIVGNVSHHATESLAAVGIAGSLLTTLAWVCSQSKDAIAAIVAEYLGLKKISRIVSLPAQTILINLVLGIFVAVVTSLFTFQIFKLYHAKDVLLDFTVSYYQIRILGFPLLLFTLSVFAVFRGLQNTFWPMLVSTIGAILNIALDYVFVYGVGDIVPEMHLEGAAWASVIAQGVMAVMAFVLLYRKTPFRLKLYRKLNPELGRLGVISVNMLVRTVALNMSLVLANVYATKYGEDVIAAFTIAFQIWMFFSFFIDGYASVSGIVSGKLKGEKRFHELRDLVNIVVKYAVVMALVLVVLCVICYNLIGAVFTKSDGVLEIFQQTFWMVLLMQPINALAFVYDDLFKGLAEAKKLRNMLLIATFLGFVPTLFLMDFFEMGLIGIWISFFVWMFLRAILLRLQFVKLIKALVVE